MANWQGEGQFASIKEMHASAWTRKSFDAVELAVKHEMQRHDTADPIRQELSEVKNTIDSSLNKSERELHAVRERLCAVCRSKSMYPCDVPSGFSLTCNFIQSNT